jgi:LuxR family maltose regulon positive regulatory protein
MFSVDPLLQQDQLLITKLRIPPTRANVVTRPRLIERLNAGIDHKLTLIDAPPGFGKTTLLADWSQHIESPIAWLSLDKEDNDPIRFADYFLASLQAMGEDIGIDLPHVMYSPPATRLQAVLTILINEIVKASDNFTLVLDDYHLIETQEIHSAMTFLLDHLPPQMHLIIAARSTPPLPIARLRARGQLIELHATDLRFRHDESKRFLKQVMGLELSEEEIAELDRRTEGWIAGLQLAGLSMAESEDIPGFIETLTGNDRYILEYLGEEILYRQPEHIQTFLLQTSILERLTGPLCDAVTGQDDAQATLEELEQANMFVFALDSSRRWYRYHRLLLDFLRARLNRLHPDLPLVLHGRASEWHEQNGLLIEAIDHGLAAADHERVARLMEKRAQTLFFDGHLATVRSWLDALPDTFVRSRPQLCLYYAWILLSSQYQFDAAEAWLMDAECALDTPAHEAVEPSTGRPTEAGTPRGNGSLRGEIATIRAHIARMRGDLSRAIDLANQANEYLPSDQLLMRAMVAWILGQAYRYRGDPVTSAQWLVRARMLSEACGNIGLTLLAFDNLARVQVMRGQLYRAAETWGHALQMAGQQTGQRFPVTALLQVGLGELLYEWNKLGAALHQVTEGISLATVEGNTAILLHAYVMLARLRQALGDSEGALATIQDALQIVQGRAAALHIAEAEAHRARLWLAQNNVEAAARWAGDSGLSVDDGVEYGRELEHITLARVLIAQGRHSRSDPALHEAGRLLERLSRAAQSAGRMGSAIEILALQALAFHTQGHTGKALIPLERALSLAEPEDYVRVFVDEGAPMAELLHHAASRGFMPDYVGGLLMAFGDSTAPAPRETPMLAEPLSKREIEVLQFLAVRLSSREIADELSISVNTVRTHIRNIYNKLDVHSRTQAVERARELGLVPS